VNATLAGPEQGHRGPGSSFPSVYWSGTRDLFLSVERSRMNPLTRGVAARDRRERRPNIRRKTQQMRPVWRMGILRARSLTLKTISNDCYSLGYWKRRLKSKSVGQDKAQSLRAGHNQLMMNGSSFSSFVFLFLCGRGQGRPRNDLLALAAVTRRVPGKTAGSERKEAILGNDARRRPSRRFRHQQPTTVQQKPRTTADRR